MRPLLLGLWVVGTAGCGLSKCEELCAHNADCIEDELGAFDTTWEDWTGFQDRSSYEAECFSVFEQSRDGGAARGDLQDTCRAELTDDCGAVSP